MSERRFPFSKTALRGSLEVFDLTHPAGQWVPSGENLGHQISKSPQALVAAKIVRFDRLESRFPLRRLFPTRSIFDQTGIEPRSFVVTSRARSCRC